MAQTSEAPRDTGDIPVESLDSDTVLAVRRILVQLAHEQDLAADEEAAQSPYWKPCPISVIGGRAAARALRAVADTMKPTLPAIGA